MLQTMKKTSPAGRFALLLMTFCMALPVAKLAAQVAAPGTIAVTPGGAEALAPSLGPKYDNRWEVYGGLLSMNGQAGQNVPKRYNMGGGEVQGTYWLGKPGDGYLKSHFGVTADGRIGAGTTPVSPNPYNLNRVLVYQEIGSGGVQWRGPKNRYVAIDLHGLAGIAHGVFDTAILNYPTNGSGVPQPTTASVGLYSNRSTGWGAAGGSIDFNQGAKVAVRLSQDINFEHYGTETREFYSVSLGVLYRLGKTRK